MEEGGISGVKAGLTSVSWCWSEIARISATAIFYLDIASKAVALMLDPIGYKLSLEMRSTCVVSRLGQMKSIDPYAQPIEDSCGETEENVLSNID